MNKIVLTILLLIIAISLVIIAYFLSPISKTGNLNGQQTKIDNTVPQSAKKPDSVSPRFQNNNLLTIKGDKIYDGQTEIFYNVPTYVKALRIGPDGHTVHFKINQTDESRYSAKYCADLTASFPPADPKAYPSSNYPMPPQHAPWDYKEIANAYTIQGCGFQDAHGFLRDSNQFVYIQIDVDQSGKLIIEKLDQKTQISVKLPAEIVNGFFTLPPNHDTNQATNIYGFDEPIFKDGKPIYLYPNKETPVTNDRILLSFAGLILAVDESENGKLLGFDQPQTNKNPDPISDTLFGLTSNPTVPAAIRSFGWEGVSAYTKLYDFSTGKLFIIDLSKLEQPAYDLLNLRKIEWVSQLGVIIHLYKENSIPYDDYKKFSDEIKDFNNQDQIKSTETHAETFFKQKYANQNVKCLLGPGEFGGCFYGTNFTTYKYLLGSGSLQKL